MYICIVHINGSLSDRLLAFIFVLSYDLVRPEIVSSVLSLVRLANMRCMTLRHYPVLGFATNFKDGINQGAQINKRSTTSHVTVQINSSYVEHAVCQMINGLSKG